MKVSVGPPICLHRRRLARVTTELWRYLHPAKLLLLFDACLRNAPDFHANFGGIQRPKAFEFYRAPNAFPR